MSGRVAVPAHAHPHGADRVGQAGRANTVDSAVLGYLDGVPLPRALLDQRLAVLRAGDAACVLPAEDSREGRQLARWVAQVILIERLCAVELRSRGERSDRAGPAGLDVSAAVAVGSIIAAALSGSATVRRVAELVTAEVVVPEEALLRAAELTEPDPSGPLWKVEHVLAADGRRPTALEPMGLVRPDELPEAVAAALASVPTGTVVGPVGDALGVHYARVTAIVDRPPPPEDGLADQLRNGARLEAFARWLNAAFAERIRLVPGLEHPGDTNQPDNLHRH